MQSEHFLIDVLYPWKTLNNQAPQRKPQLIDYSNHCAICSTAFKYVIWFTKKRKKSQEKKSVWGLFITSIGAIHPEIFSKRGVLLSSFQISWFQIVEHKIFKIEPRLPPSSTVTTLHSHPWAPLDVSGVINMADFKDSEFLLDDTTSGWSLVQSKNKYAKQEKRLTLPNIRAYTTRLLITQLSLF